MRRILLIGAAAMALAACNPEQPQQVAAGDPASFALLYAPATLQPAAQPVPVYYAPQPVAQQYWDDAYLMNHDYYNQPPAYFNYAGATPLVWTQQPIQQQSLGDTLKDIAITRIVEALVGGGTREYYYQPGYEQPFFVRDPQYAYAYDPDGRLIALYDPYGAPLQQPILVQQAPLAASYLMRADNLRDAALAATLQALAPDVWTTQRAVLVSDFDDVDDERARVWKTWWTEPGDNRSPVAVQRLAEVRARKAARDAAHDEWKEDKAFAKAEMKSEKWDHKDRGGEGPKAKAGKSDNDRSVGGKPDKADKVDKPDKAKGGGNDAKAEKGGGKPDKAGGGKADKGGDKGNGGGKKD